MFQKITKRSFQIQYYFLAMNKEMKALTQNNT